jgi:hypothetical protein
MAVYVEVGVVPVHPLADEICKPPDGKNVAAAIQI